MLPLKKINELKTLKKNPDLLNFVLGWFPEQLLLKTQHLIQAPDKQEYSFIVQLPAQAWLLILW